MKFSELLAKRLLIVSGKGGVGKTTLALALSLAAAQAGRKVLLAEINSEEQVAHLLERKPIGYRETEILPNLWALNVQPNESFKEYVLTQIRFKTLYRAVFENRLVRHFIEATPGLADLMCIGKIYERTPHYDLTVIDAPASGHSIALLQIASIVASAVRVGPLRTQAQKIEELLHDPARTLICGVTLPEEMPVTEMTEMATWLEERLKLSLGPVFLNQFQEEPFSRKEAEELARLARLERSIDPAVLKALELQRAGAQRSRFYRQRLAEALPNHPVIPIPFIYSSQFGLTEIETIAEGIEREMS